MKAHTEGVEPARAEAHQISWVELKGRINYLFDNSSLAPLTTWLRVLIFSDLKLLFQVQLIKILTF
jgi:hypothetical protein